MNIYLKSEPSGEYSMGKISEEDLIKYGIIGDKGYDFDSLSEYIYEYDDFFHVYGICSSIEDNWENILDIDISDSDMKTFIDNCTLNIYDVKEDYNEEKEVSILNGLNEGYYVIMSAPSKYSADFDIDVDNFDITKLKLSFDRIITPTLVEDDYGEIDYSFLTKIEYDGEDYTDEYFDSFVDRGYNYNISIIKVESNGEYTIIVDNNQLK